MSDMLKLRRAGQAGYTIVTVGTGPTGGGGERLKDGWPPDWGEILAGRWPDWVITEAAQLPGSPHVHFESFTDAATALAGNFDKFYALAGSSTSAARKLVVHAAHDPKTDLEIGLDALRFVEPFTAKGVEVVLAVGPKTWGDV